jgi:AmmeMemoRadiSam system protein B
LTLLASVFSLVAADAADAADAAKLRSPFEAEVGRAIAEFSSTSPASSASPASPSGGSGKETRILGGITPHHNLALGMILRFYERVASPETRRVWLLSPDHFRRARKSAVICDGDWALASGTLRADREACEALASLSIAEADADIFKLEHGITLHIPLIARYFPNAEVVPMVLNPRAPDIALLVLRNKIREIMRDDDVIILSMDLSHYKTPEGMAAEDAKTLPVLETLAHNATRGLDVDAGRAAFLVLSLFKDMGATRGTVLEHTDSSALLGRRVESGTSYATMIYASL